MNKMYLYFAYGSNMNPQRIASRCPGAIVVGIATLRDYKVSERLYADIDYEEGSEIQGILYLITDKHLNALDRFEGYPSVYRRIWVDVELGNETYHAITYEMSCETKIVRNNIPYPEEYRKICSDGAKFYKIKNNFLRKQKMKTVKLIVYGTLMSGEANHFYCANAIKITPCTIVGTLYDTGYGYPAFVPEGNNVVQAELIEIPIEDWESVDRLEGYPRLYDRQLLQTTLADGGESTGWVYIMNKLPPMATVIENGSWKAYRHG